ncbi:hypothetical protein ACH43Y_28770 [Streptomyces rubiginosohelvolus]|uniref:hypothetical protein n=1 Tax=Streptomyces rubiginosohelvolus TaxID=67362 RepID=UPI0037A31BA6
MSRRKKAVEEPEETAPEPSREAGGCVLAALVIALGAVLFAVLGTLAVLVVWAVGAVALRRAVRRPNKIENHSPPPPRDPSRNTNTQFTVVEDRPGHCTIVWSKGATE